MLRKELKLHFFLVFISAVLTSVSFLSFIKSGFLIFFSLVPLFYVAGKTTDRFRLIYFLVWGMIVHLTALYWLTHVTWAGYIVLAGYHTLYIFLFAFLWKYCKNIFQLALLWVSLEWLKQTLFGGSPLGILGGTLSFMPEAIQISSFGGILLVNFWIVFLNLLLADMLISAWWSLSSKKNRVYPLILLSICFLPFCYGIARLHFKSLKQTDNYLKVAVIQPNISPDIKWSSEKEKQQFESILNLSFKLINDKPDILVLPETVFTMDFRYSPSAVKLLESITKSLECKILFGSPDDQSLKGESYNSAFLIDSALVPLFVYHKVNLVPFGETIPFHNYFPQLKVLTPVTEGFIKGKKLPFFQFSENIFISPLICFEDTLSDFVRKCSNQGADVLITLTNNGWFPGLFGPVTHELLARFRAVENGIPLIRCSNTGVSSWIDSRGKVVKCIQNEEGQIEGIPGIMMCEIPLFSKETTLFSKIGYSWIFMLIFSVLIWELGKRKW